MAFSWNGTVKDKVKTCFKIVEEVFPHERWNFMTGDTAANPNLTHKTRVQMRGKETHKNWYLLDYITTRNVSSFTCALGLWG
jgi:hypothetical protein